MAVMAGDGDAGATPAAGGGWVDDVTPGKELGSRRLVADVERVRRYLCAVGATNPWYTDASPLGYPVAPAALFAREPFTFTGYRLRNRSDPVNQALEWDFLYPVRVGEELIARARVVDRLVDRRERVVFETTFSDADGRIALRALATVSYPVPGATPAPRRPAPAAGEPGRPLAPFSRTIDLAMSRAVFHDEAGWHSDPAAARERGYERVVVGGPHLVCLMSECLTRELGTVWLGGGHLAARFLRPVLVDDTVTVQPFVLAPSEQPLPDGLALTLRCENQRGEPVAVASAFVRGAPGGRAPV
jgi:acyl dehydratase